MTEPWSARTDLVAAVRAQLARAADPARAVAQQRYMKSALPFHGVAMAQVRRIVRDLAGAHPITTAAQWEATVRALWDGATHREERYAATALARQPRYRAFRTTATLPLLRHMIGTGAWWDHVDEIASHLLGEVLQREPHVVAPVLRDWADDDDMWVRRSAILAQLRAKAATDTDLLAHCLEANLTGSRHGGEFFVRKAVGWALREYAKTDAAWVQAFLAEHRDRLSPLSVREASRHLARA
ncbi:DNA alkylation repair protein [Pseudactinotalea sp. Z1739]|uniref:DNA alkylation repair protein n=1 Tax=Pseudactinotalea sp. Z1739 TaxID=3413028 RepID=UPI003C7DEF8F